MASESDNPTRDELRIDEEQLDAISEEPAVLKAFVKIFGGSQRWLMNVVIVVTTLFAVLMFASLYMFFVAETTRAQIGWSMGFLYFALAVAMLKIWTWGEMRRYALLKEVKRVQLKVDRLNARLEARRDG